MRLISRVSLRFDQTFGSQKATIALTALFATVVIGFWSINRLARTAPSRPNGVPADAVFLWAPAVGFPGGLPRRGSWLACLDAEGHDQCALWTMDGVKKFDGQFVTYPELETLSEDQLKIDATKTADADSVWTGAIHVPAIYLENGRILIPRDGLTDLKRRLDERRASRQ